MVVVMRRRTLKRSRSFQKNSRPERRSFRRDEAGLQNKTRRGFNTNQGESSRRPNPTHVPQTPFPAFLPSSSRSSRFPAANPFPQPSPAVFSRSPFPHPSSAAVPAAPSPSIIPQTPSSLPAPFPSHLSQLLIPALHLKPTRPVYLKQTRHLYPKPRRPFTLNLAAHFYLKPSSPLCPMPSHPLCPKVSRPRTLYLASAV